jgi:hypothetical protein
MEGICILSSGSEGTVELNMAGLFSEDEMVVLYFGFVSLSLVDVVLVV